MGFSSLSVHFSGESVILVGFSSLSVHFFWLWFDGWVLVNRWLLLWLLLQWWLMMMMISDLFLSLFFCLVVDLAAVVG